MVKNTRQLRYRQSLHARGLKRITLWVPADPDAVAKVQALAGQLVADHKPEPDDNRADLFEGMLSVWMIGDRFSKHPAFVTSNLRVAHSGKGVEFSTKEEAEAFLERHQARIEAMTDYLGEPLKMEVISVRRSPGR